MQTAFFESKDRSNAQLEVGLFSDKRVIGSRQPLRLLLYTRRTGFHGRPDVKTQSCFIHRQRALRQVMALNNLQVWECTFELGLAQCSGNPSFHVCDDATESVQTTDHQMAAERTRHSTGKWNHDHSAIGLDAERKVRKARKVARSFCMFQRDEVPDGRTFAAGDC